MPKDRRVNSSSFDRAMVSPYACSLNNSDNKKPESSSPSVGDEREWEEARCPICMEHPHNAVLLLCSSKDKGCRPFMCDTSYRHSNCLDQFCKSSSGASLLNQKPDLVCPLCRGLITGWVVIEPARSFMNSKTRSCSLETCSFNGNYAELRKHARLEHPSNRPAEASPTRQSDWAVMQQQREIEDALAHQSDMEYDFDRFPTLEEWFEDDMWSNGSFFDFPTGISDIEDELIDEMFSGNGLSWSFFNLYSSSTEEEMMDSGSSGSSDRSNNSVPRSSNHGGNGLPSSRARSSFHVENGPSRTRSRSIPDFHRGNDVRNTTSRSGQRRGNTSAISGSRPRYHREISSTSSRSRSSYHREGGSSFSRSRSSYHRENAPSGSRTRSNYRRGDARLSSRERPR